MKKLSVVFSTLAVILSDVMCAVVAFRYCDAVWKIKYEGYSAPAATAFIYAVPYLIAIVVCIVMAVATNKRFKV